MTKGHYRPATDEFNRKGWSYTQDGQSVFGITPQAAYTNWLNTPVGIAFDKARIFPPTVECLWHEDDPDACPFCAGTQCNKCGAPGMRYDKDCEHDSYERHEDHGRYLEPDEH